MAAGSYEDVLSRILTLTAEEQTRLLQDLAALIPPERADNLPHSILELQGLGKEVWDGMDAQAYIDRERDSWSG